MTPPPATVHNVDPPPHRLHLQQRLYSPADAVLVLRMSRARIYELIASGELASLKVGRSRRVTSEALDAFVNSLTETEPVEATTTRPRPTATTRPPKTAA